MELTVTQKRKFAQKVPKLWNALRPLQRSRIFHMKPTCLFVFHTWEELDKRQKEIVYNAVRVCIEQAILHEEISKFIEELNRIGRKHLPHLFEKAFRGEPCVGCGNPATAVNKDSLCRKCFENPLRNLKSPKEILDCL